MKPKKIESEYYLVEARARPTFDIASEFEIHKAESLFMAVIQFVGLEW